MPIGGNLPIEHYPGCEQYHKCRVCGGPLAAAMVEWAHRRFEVQPCSPECITAEVKRVYACCDKAEFTPCVCMYSFTCPDHGDRHVGTHE